MKRANSKIKRNYGSRKHFLYFSKQLFGGLSMTHRIHNVVMFGIFSTKVMRFPRFLNNINVSTTTTTSTTQNNVIYRIVP